MKISNDKKLALLVTDIDNTIFDWVAYYVHAFEAMLEFVGDVIGTPSMQLAAEAQAVFAAHRSIEYPFVVQELPAVVQHYGFDVDAMLSELIEPARAVFKAVGAKYLQLYPQVYSTLVEIKKRHPQSPIVALTDAPRYVAMWKLNKLGVLHCFDAIYGLADPRIPTDPTLGRVKVDPKILMKHLQQYNFGYQGKIRTLPDDYEKPGVRGLKTVLMDFEIDDDVDAKARTIWVGDNLRKDVGLGNRVGVKTFWAEYGTQFDASLLPRLAKFSPPDNVQRNVALDANSEEAPKPVVRLRQFSELLNYL